MLQDFHCVTATNGKEAVKEVKKLMEEEQVMKMERSRTSNGKEKMKEEEEGLVSLPFPFTASLSSSSSSSPSLSTLVLPVPPTLRRQFDLILSEVIMPVMDGLSAAREIRSIEKANSLPPVEIVALTECDDAGQREVCREWDG